MKENIIIVLRQYYKVNTNRDECLIKVPFFGGSLILASSSWPCSYIFEMYHEMFGHHLLFKQTVKLPTSMIFIKTKHLFYLLIDIISMSQGILKPDAYCKVVQFPLWIQLGDIKRFHLESQKKSHLSPDLSKLIAENNKICILESYIAFKVVIKSVRRYKNIPSKISK